MHGQHLRSVRPDWRYPPPPNDSDLIEARRAQRRLQFERAFDDVLARLMVALGTGAISLLIAMVVYLAFGWPRP